MFWTYLNFYRLYIRFIHRYTAHCALLGTYMAYANLTRITLYSALQCFIWNAYNFIRQHIYLYLCQCRYMHIHYRTYGFNAIRTLKLKHYNMCILQFKYPQRSHLGRNKYKDLVQNLIIVVHSNKKDSKILFGNE